MNKIKVVMDMKNIKQILKEEIYNITNQEEKENAINSLLNILIKWKQKMSIIMKKKRIL